MVGDGLGCQAFAGLLHGALRALIDLLGVAAFNVSILNIKVGPSATHGPVVARWDSPAWVSLYHSDAPATCISNQQIHLPFTGLSREAHSVAARLTLGGWKSLAGHRSVTQTPSKSSRHWTCRWLEMTVTAKRDNAQWSVHAVRARK